MSRVVIVSYAVFAGLLVSLYLNLSWPWGVLFIFWAVLSFRTGEAFLIASISRRQTPVLFWSITVLWFLLGVASIADDVVPLSQ